jgi:hypothetical protein
MKKTKSLGRFAIMFMDFGQSGGKIVKNVIDGMAEREFRQIISREDPSDFSAKGFIHPVIVIGVKESALREILAQPLNFFLTEPDVTMASHEEEWMLKELWILKLQNRLLLHNLYAGSLINFTHQVRDDRPVVVPIASTTIFQSSHRQPVPIVLALSQSINACCPNQDDETEEKSSNKLALKLPTHDTNSPSFPV